MECLVYQVVQDVEVRWAPSTDNAYRTSRWFRKGDLVSIDLIRQDYVTDNDTKEKDGPFLRLSDGSGWVFENKQGQGVMMVPKAVEKVLECFFVENFPAGIALRSHPIDKFNDNNNLIKQVPQVHLRPMEKVYCDRRVKGKDGVNFYRVQQGPSQCPAWVFDRRGDDNFMLLPASKVEVGMFAFRVKATAGVGIRLIPNVGNETKSGWSVEANELIVCDIIRESPEPEHGNGPFLRLIDGSGWLFCKKYHEEIMEAVPIEEGTWMLRVQNSGGIALRKQPIDQTKSKFNKVYAQNEVVTCDRKIGPSPSGTTFYRVETTEGWVFDKRGDHPMMELISSSRPMKKSRTTTGSNGWTPDFVRGVASAAAEGIQEISFNAESRVISFRHPIGARINVYYTTRTVGTALQHPRQGRTQLFRRNCSMEEVVEIFKDPRVHTGHGYQRAAQEVVSSSFQGVSTMMEEEIDAEDDLRNRLLDVCDENDSARRKVGAIWRSISVHQADRISAEAKQRKMFATHLQALSKELQEKEKVRQQQQAARELQDRTCQECGRVLGSLHALEQHTRDAHPGFNCHVCGKWFSTQHGMYQHKNAVGHW